MAQDFFWPLKETMLKHRQYIYFYIFWRAILNETSRAKYDGLLPRISQVRPKSEIYTPKWDDEHPHGFHMRNLSPQKAVLKEFPTSLQRLKTEQKIIRASSFNYYDDLSLLLYPEIIADISRRHNCVVSPRNAIWETSVEIPYWWRTVPRSW